MSDVAEQSREDQEETIKVTHWVLYVEREIKGQERMVPLTKEGKVITFPRYDLAEWARTDHPMSVVGVVEKEIEL